MRALLIIACVCLASAAPQEKTMAQTIARSYGIKVEEAQACINKTQVTRDELVTFQEELRSPSSNPTTRENGQKASCTMACVAQAQETMVGAQLQASKLHAILDEEVGMDDELKARHHKYIDKCVDEVKDFTDECEVILQYFKCMMTEYQIPHSVNDN